MINTETIVEKPTLFQEMSRNHEFIAQCQDNLKTIIDYRNITGSELSNQVLIDYVNNKIPIPLRIIVDGKISSDYEWSYAAQSTYEKSRNNWSGIHGTYSEAVTKELKDAIDVINQLWVDGKLSCDTLKIQISTYPSLQSVLK